MRDVQLILTFLIILTNSPQFLVWCKAVPRSTCPRLAVRLQTWQLLPEVSKSCPQIVTIISPCPCLGDNPFLLLSARKCLLRSPHYPGMYPANLTCSYHVFVLPGEIPPGKQVDHQHGHNGDHDHNGGHDHNGDHDHNGGHDKWRLKLLDSFMLLGLKIWNKSAFGFGFPTSWTPKPKLG